MSILINQSEKDFLKRRGYNVSKVYTEVETLNKYNKTYTKCVPVMFGLSKDKKSDVLFTDSFEKHSENFEYYYDNITPINNPGVGIGVEILKNEIIVK